MQFVYNIITRQSNVCLLDCEHAILTSESFILLWFEYTKK